ncbi:MAG: hypothetical protein FWG98_15500 [Candidatus Cloacimonetes bacterium]|nr:hypothetical protein [Candidatus Cloacimonadota bacterium]
MFRTLKISKTKTIAVIALVIVVLTVAMSCTNNPTNQQHDVVVEKGELKAILYSDIIDELLEEFLRDYAQWNLEIKSQLLDGWLDTINFFRFTFNNELIVDLSLIEMLSVDHRVYNADVNDPKLVWESGLLGGWLMDAEYIGDLEKLIDDIESLNPSWELKYIPYLHAGWKPFLISYNPEMVDDFELVEILRRDKRIDRIEPYWVRIHLEEKL